MSEGYVYILSNPCMPGLVKIGRSIHGGSRRASQLYQTGVAAPFNLEFELYGDDFEETERRAHEILKDYRESEARGFFRVDTGTAIEAVMSAFSTYQEFAVVDSDMAGVAVDLSCLAWKYGRPVEDVLFSVAYLSEFSIAQAIDERRASVARSGRKGFAA